MTSLGRGAVQISLYSSFFSFRSSILQTIYLDVALAIIETNSFPSITSLHGTVTVRSRVGIPEEAAHQYAKIFTENRMTLEIMPSMDRSFLRDLGITVIGDIMKILQHVSSSSTPDSTTYATINPTPRPVPTVTHKSAKLPSITSDMTHPQFHKFKID